MEDFAIAEKIRQKRNSPLGNKVEEIKNISRPQPKAAPVVKTSPVVSVPNPVVDNKDISKETSKEDVVSLDKGFVVGTSKEGKLSLRKFGNVNALELAGFASFAQRVVNETLDTRNTKIDNGLQAIAQGINVLLQDKKAQLGK